MHTLRTRPALAGILLCIGLAACAPDLPSPTQPGLPSFALEAGDAELAATIRAQIDRLFLDVPRRNQAHQHFTQVESAWLGGQTRQALSKVDILMRHTLDQLAGGGIADPDGSGPQTPATGVAAFFNNLLAYTGQPFFEPGENQSAVYVFPSNQDQTIDSGLDLIVRIPGGSLSQSAILLIERDGDGAVIADGFAPASDLYDVRFIPAVTFTEIDVGICLYPSIPVGARLAHGLASGAIDLIDPSAVPLPCLTTPHPGAAQSSGGALGTLASWGRRALGLLTPSVAYAGHAALAGTVRELSPFQVVNTVTGIEASVAPATWGGSVNVAATLTVVEGGSVLSGRSLTLTVDGTEVGAATTDLDGVARWSFPAGEPGSYPYEIDFAGELTELDEFRFLAAEATGSFVVGKAALTLTASSATVFIGAPIPACTVTYAGLVGDDTPASLGTLSTCSYPATPGTTLVYPTAITPDDYTVTRVPGTFIYQYAPQSGTFISPLPMREIRRGSNVPVKFRLVALDGTTPVPGAVITLRVVNTSGYTNALGTLVYSASERLYALNVGTSGWPLGVVTLVARLEDGSEYRLDVMIKK